MGFELHLACRLPATPSYRAWWLSTSFDGLALRVCDGDGDGALLGGLIRLGRGRDANWLPSLPSLVTG